MSEGGASHHVHNMQWTLPPSALPPSLAREVAQSPGGSADINVTKLRFICIFRECLKSYSLTEAQRSQREAKSSVIFLFCGSVPVVRNYFFSRKTHKEHREKHIFSRLFISLFSVPLCLCASVRDYSLFLTTGTDITEGETLSTVSFLSFFSMPL